jgi:lysylphosphatidylglycerol synthetase-like protein (DUF2156 family)
VVDLPPPIDAGTLAALRVVSDAWLAAGAHRERTFTLGRFDPAYLRDTPVIAVIDSVGGIQAFANVLPAYRSPNASFDLMRRRDGYRDDSDFIVLEDTEGNRFCVIDTGGR